MSRVYQGEVEADHRNMLLSKRMPARLEIQKDMKLNCDVRQADLHDWCIVSSSSTLLPQPLG